MLQRESLTKCIVHLYLYSTALYLYMQQHNLITSDKLPKGKRLRLRDQDVCMHLWPCYLFSIFSLLCYPNGSMQAARLKEALYSTFGWAIKDIYRSAQVNSIIPALHHENNITFLPACSRRKHCFGALQELRLQRRRYRGMNWYYHAIL